MTEPMSRDEIKLLEKLYDFHRQTEHRYRGDIEARCVGASHACFYKEGPLARTLAARGYAELVPGLSPVDQKYLITAAGIAALADTPDGISEAKQTRIAREVRG